MTLAHPWFIQEVLKVFKNMGKMLLGFLFCLKIAIKESCFTMDLCCNYSLMLKALQPVLLLYLPVLHCFSCSHQLCIFPLKLFLLMQAIRPCPIVICPRICSPPYIPRSCLSSPLQSTLLTRKPLKQLLPLILPSMFLPSCYFSNSHYETNMQHENCWPIFWPQILLKSARMLENSLLSLYQKHVFLHVAI